MALRDVDEGADDDVIERERTHLDPASAAVPAGDLPIDRLDERLLGDRRVEISLQPAENLRAVDRIRTGQLRQGSKGRNLRDPITEDGGKGVVDDRQRGISGKACDDDRNRQVLEHPAELGLFCGQALFGELALRNVGQNAFPNRRPIIACSRDGFGGDPTHLPIDNHTGFPVKGSLLAERLDIELNPGIEIIGMNTGKALERVLPSLLAVEPRELEKTRTHERKMRQPAIGRLDHGVGSNRDVLGEVIGRPFQ